MAVYKDGDKWRVIYRYTNYKGERKQTQKRGFATKLKAFSDEHGICLLVVHHTRKMESSDSFDMISGTNGLLGAADGAFVMQKEKRTDNKAVLEVAGRDQQDQRLLLDFDREQCVWKLTGEKVDESLRGKLQRIQQQEKKLKEDRNVLHQKKNRGR